MAAAQWGQAVTTSLAPEAAMSRALARAREAKAALGRDEMSAVADKGYFSGREILACYEDGITTTLPRPETSGNRKKGMYVKADFAYDADVIYQELTHALVSQTYGLGYQSTGLCTTEMALSLSLPLSQPLSAAVSNNFCDSCLIARRRPW